MVSLKPLAFALIAGCVGDFKPAISGDEQHVIQLLESRQCPACRLNDVDLTHADLRDADLKEPGCNVRTGQSRLDGADFSQVTSVSQASRVHRYAVRTYETVA